MMFDRAHRAADQSDAVDAEMYVPVPDDATWWARLRCSLLGHRFTATGRRGGKPPALAVGR